MNDGNGFEYFRVFNRLYEYMEDIYKTNNDASSPVYLTAQFGNIDVLSYLISKRIDVGQEGCENFTFLRTAAKYNHCMLVEQVLKETNHFPW